MWRQMVETSNHGTSLPQYTTSGDEFAPLRDSGGTAMHSDRVDDIGDEAGRIRTGSREVALALSMISAMIDQT